MSAPGAPAITLHERVNPPTEPPERPDLFVLRNEFPAPLTHEGRTYPTVIHAYWALAAADRSDHDRIQEAATVREAHEFGGRCPLRPGWAVIRTAVMADLLRAKFTQHPDLAEILLSTGDARISYTSYSESPFWTDRGPREGRNWTGRLLELIRAELHNSQTHHPRTTDSSLRSGGDKGGRARAPPRARALAVRASAGDGE
ncbi:NADAR family protein, partial [Actinomadura sp. KC06]